MTTLLTMQDVADCVFVIDNFDDDDDDDAQICRARPM